jgi:hypothetical protein
VRHDVTTNPLRVTDEVAALRAHPYKRSSELAGGLCDNLYTWNIDFLHDNHVHPGTAITGVKSGSFTIPTSGHDFAGNTRNRIKLTVTDSNGLQTSKSVTIWPDKVNLSFDTSPSGLNLHVDGISRPTPFVLDTLVGFNHTIEARDQTSGNNNYAFSSWSDGGTRSHTITVPSAVVYGDLHVDPAALRTDRRVGLQRRERNDGSGRLRQRQHRELGERCLLGGGKIRQRRDPRRGQRLPAGAELGFARCVG